MDDKLKMSERMRRDYIGPGYLFPEWWIGEIADLETALASAQEENRKLRARFSDLVVDMMKHSKDHIHDSEPDKRLGAAVEGVCADRINAILLSTPPSEHRDGVVEEVNGPGKDA